MGSKEDVKSPKSEKESPSKQEQTNIHLYPDWATIQTYYGSGVPMQSAVMAGHVPHPHVWAPPQHMMSPYGVPYSTIYSPGIVYAHPAVPLVATPVSAQLLSNSTENMDVGIAKKLKRSDGVAMQLVNDNSEVDGEGSAHGASQSVEHGIDASSNASDGDIGDERQLKREKRKQANRESARRSRLRKQAETEELMERYETLKVENITLKSEINKLMEDSERLRVENAAMIDKLNGGEAAHPGEMVVYGIGPELAQPNHGEDRFMLNNSSSVNGNKRGQTETHDDSNSEMKLQIFGSKADAVATN